jgi:hypothetical protein
MSEKKGIQVASTVWYWSSTHQKYVQMTVERVHSDGRLTLSGKRGEKIDPSLVATGQEPPTQPPSRKRSRPTVPAFGGDAQSLVAQDQSALGDGSGSGSEVAAAGAENPQQPAVAPEAKSPSEDDAEQTGEEHVLENGDVVALQYVKGALSFLGYVAEQAQHNKLSMAKQLAQMFPPGPELKKALIKRISWNSEKGYLTFQRQPKGTCKGHMHITMLMFTEDSFPGNGVYLQDALMMLEQRGLEEFDHVITVRPQTASQDLSCFGWVPDGAIVNGTRSFALSVLAMYSLVGHWADVTHASAWPGEVPAAIGAKLSAVKCKYVRRENMQDRVLSNLVESAVNNKTNRSIEDPIFMSQEMMRCSCQAHNVKTIMSLYKQRTMANPSLKMQLSVEACTLRFMEAGKIAQETKSVIAADIAQKTWQGGVFSAHALMAAKFPVGVALAEWFDELLIKHAVQTAQGQLLATNLAIQQTEAGTKITQSDFDVLCVTSGMWVVIKENVLPQLAFGDKDVEILTQEVKDSSSLRGQIHTLTCKEPPRQLSNFMDMANWVLEHVRFIRLAKEEKSAALAKPGKDHPTTVLNQVEQRELNNGIYIGQLTLDVNMYREAVKKRSNDAKNEADVFEKATKAHVADVRSAQDFFQLSDIVVAPHGPGQDTKRAGTWFQHGVVAARSNLDRLAKLYSTAAGKEDIAVVNIVALNALGTLKMQVLEKLKREYPHLPGVTLVMHPLIPSDCHRYHRDKQSEQVAAVGADGGDSDDEESDLEHDPTSHDFVDGQLPDAITKAVAKMSTKQRLVQLMHDYETIQRALVFDCVSKTHFARGLRCAHAVDSSGAREVTEGLLLIPAADEVLTGLESSTAYRTGMFTDVPTSSAYVAVTKKTRC